MMQYSDAVQWWTPQYSFTAGTPVITWVPPERIAQGE